MNLRKCRSCWLLKLLLYDLLLRVKTVLRQATTACDTVKHSVSDYVGVKTPGFHGLSHGLMWSKTQGLAEGAKRF